MLAGEHIKTHPGRERSPKANIKEGINTQTSRSIIIRLIVNTLYLNPLKLDFEGSLRQQPTPQRKRTLHHYD